MFESNTINLYNLISSDIGNKDIQGIMCWNEQHNNITVSKGAAYHRAKLKRSDLLNKYINDAQAVLQFVKQQYLRGIYEDQNNKLEERENFTLIGEFPKWVTNHSQSQQSNEIELSDTIKEIYERSLHNQLSQEEYLLEYSTLIIAKSRNPHTKAKEIGSQIAKINTEKLARESIIKQYEHNQEPWMNDVINMFNKFESQRHHYTNVVFDWTNLTNNELQEKEEILRGIVFIYSERENIKKSLFCEALTALYHGKIISYTQCDKIDSIKYMYDGTKPFHLFETSRSDDIETFPDQWYAMLEQMKINRVDSTKYVPLSWRGVPNLVMCIGNTRPRGFPALSRDRYMVFSISDDNNLIRDETYNQI